MSGLLASICCPNCGGASHTVSTNQPMSAAFPPIKQVELSASKISYLIFTLTSSAVSFAAFYQMQSLSKATVNVCVNKKSFGFPFGTAVTDYCHLVVRSGISSYTGTVGCQLKSFSFRILDVDNFEPWGYKHRTLLVFFPSHSLYWRWFGTGGLEVDQQWPSFCLLSTFLYRKAR